MWQALRQGIERSMASPSGQRRAPRLRVEGLEDRLCPSQYLLVSDATNDNILRYDGTDGHFIDTFVPKGSGGTNSMEYMVPTADGQAMLVDAGTTSTVLRFSLTDGSPDPAPRQGGAGFVRPKAGGLATPEGIVYDPDGNVLVANLATMGNVLKYDPFTGAFLGVFLDTGAGDDLSAANDMHIGPDGDLYVTSTKGSGFNNGNLLRFDPTTGDPLPGPGRTGANFVDPLTTEEFNAFTWGPDGNLYVSADDPGSHGSILRYDGTTGDPLPAQGQSGAVFVPQGSGGVGFIDSIVFDTSGNLLAADGNGAVQKYDGTTGASLGTFIATGSGGLKFAAGLLFYDQPTPAAGQGSQHHTHPVVTFGNLLPTTSTLSNPLSAESSAAVVQAAPESLPSAPTVASTEAAPSGSSAASVAHGWTDPLAPLTAAEQPLSTQDLFGLP